MPGNLESIVTQDGFSKTAIIGWSVALSVVGILLLRRYVGGRKCDISRDLAGQFAVITGGNTGIGYETAKRLIELGCEVVIGARDEAKNQSVEKELRNHGAVHTFRLDLSDKQSVERFAYNVQKLLNGRPLGFLINNAGVFGIPERRLTKEGIQLTLATNHLGHFYLTFLLWKNLKTADSPRIVNVSAKMPKDFRKSFQIDFEDLKYERNYSPISAYARSKKANVMFTNQLQRRMIDANMHGIVVSLHPGVIRTQITRNILNSVFKRILYWIFAAPFVYLLFKTPKQGAQTTLYTVLEREDKLVKGSYYSDCQVKAVESVQAMDPQAAKKLWKKSEELLNIKFDL